jgi:hypothetical protein
VITLIAFPEKAKPGAVATDVLHNLALWDGVLAAVPGVIAALCYARYRITRRSYDETREALAKRRAQALAAAAPLPDAAE